MTKPRRNKLGRNDLCWCESGKKYKFCHLGREREQPFDEWQMSERLNRRYSERTCVHPEAGVNTCSGGIVRAHSIQRTGGLSSIASKDGYVYGFVPDGVDFALSTRNSISSKDFVLEKPKRVGIRQASTFTGLCSRHDNDVFGPIEKGAFVVCEEHAFLLAYRAICRSYFMKLGTANYIMSLHDMDKGKPVDRQLQDQLFLKLWKSQQSLVVKAATDLKDQYDKALLSRDYSGTHYCVVRLDQLPSIMCNGATNVYYDFQGRTLQPLETPLTSQEHITFSIITTDSGGMAVFSWFGDWQVPKNLVSSFLSLPGQEKDSALCRFAFEYFENTFAAPTWWDNLPEIHKRAILRRSKNVDHRPNGLLEDGRTPLFGTIKSVETNLF